MKTPPEIEAEIVRLHHAERWPVGTIARQLGVHHSVVRRVLARTGLLPVTLAARPSHIEPYLPLMRETLDKYPTLRASRLLEMMRARGYRGRPSRFREVVATIRPRPKAEAYLRLSMLPGEQAQVDWAHFGKLRLGRAERTLMAFVVVLSWSRRVFVRFFLDARMPSFLRGHVQAFERLGGVPRVLLYDNLRSAVLERRGDLIRFHPTLLALAAHYRFAPRPCAPARGNEKGRVERAIRYLRDSFFAARRFADLDDLNAQADAWCDGPALDRPWPGERARSVRDAADEERVVLLPLPDEPFPCEETLAVQVGKTPYVRFDLNDYSVPHTHVQRELQVVAAIDTVRIVDGATVLAVHPRSYDRGLRVEDPQHLQALVETKHAARQHRGIDRLHVLVASSQAYLMRCVERGQNLGTQVAQLLRLLDEHGAAPLEHSLAAACAQDICHIPSVRQLLQQHLRAHPSAPPLQLGAPGDARLRDLFVRPHDLHPYDHLQLTIEEESDVP